MSDDELVGSEEEYTAPAPRKKAKGKKKAEEAEYQIRHALKPPRATSYSAQALYGSPSRKTFARLPHN